MPPLIKIKKEEIINVAINIIRNESFESVNARRVAKELNCSVQPIFSNFKNMEELKKAVVNKSCEIFYETITRVKEGSTYEYKQVGLNYINFAKEEPNIFNLIFSNNNITEESLLDNNDIYYQKIMDIIGKGTTLEESKIPTFHFKMWIFTHGLATLVANKFTFTESEINDLLTSEFKALLLEEEGKRK